MSRTILCLFRHNHSRVWTTHEACEVVAVLGAEGRTLGGNLLWSLRTTCGASAFTKHGQKTDRLFRKSISQETSLHQVYGIPVWDGLYTGLSVWINADDPFTTIVTAVEFWNRKPEVRWQLPQIRRFALPSRPFGTWRINILFESFERKIRKPPVSWYARDTFSKFKSLFVAQHTAYYQRFANGPIDFYIMLLSHNIQWLFHTNVFLKFYLFIYLFIYLFFEICGWLLLCRQYWARNILPHGDIEKKLLS